MSNNEIQIDAEALNTIAGELDAIKGTLEKNCPEAYEKTGSGLSADVLDSMNAEFDGIKTAVVTLIDKTKTFMTQAAESARGMDDAAAGRINSER